MSVNKLLVAAALAAAIGAPFKVIAEDKKVAQPMTLPEYGPRSSTGFPLAKSSDSPSWFLSSARTSG